MVVATNRVTAFMQCFDHSRKRWGRRSLHLYVVLGWLDEIIPTTSVVGLVATNQAFGRFPSALDSDNILFYSRLAIWSYRPSLS